MSQYTHPHHDGAGVSEGRRKIRPLLISSVLSLTLIQQLTCHPERSWERSLRPTESKDLRLHFGRTIAGDANPPIALTPPPCSREDTRVADTIHCDTHGETNQAFVCTHLAGETSGLGFNRNDPDAENPTPDAWCDNCEIIRTVHGGWTDEAQKLSKIVLLCAGCYERARIRNTRPSVTLDDLAGLRWKCGSCDEWHTGPALDFGYSAPYYWGKDEEKASRWTNLIPRAIKKPSKTFLDLDYCAINDESFFVRGLIHLPIIGAAETFRWGVWGSLSRKNFETLLASDGDSERVDQPPMFSWLSTQIPEYPDSLNLRMYAHIQEPGSRPHFRLEPSEHPLAQEYHHGISPERITEIMFRRLP